MSVHANIHEEKKAQDSNDLSSEEVKSEGFPLTAQGSEHKTIRSLNLFKKNFSRSKDEVREVEKEKDTNEKTEKLTKPLTLFKEDLSAIFKINVSKERLNKDLTRKPSPSELNRDGNVLKTPSVKHSDKNVKVETETQDTETCESKDLSPMSQKKNTSSLNLFKSDFSSDKEADKDINLKTSQSRELINPLIILKEDFNSLKEDFAVLFKSNLTKQGDDKDAATKSNVKPQKNVTSKVDRGGNILQIFQKVNVNKRNKEQTKISFTSSKLKKKDNREESRAKEEKQEASGSLPLRTSLTGLPFVSLTDKPRSNQLTEDLWSLKNFASYLTLDPNTANSEIYLSDSNRKAQRLWLDHQTQEHPDRFEYCPQVLCREGLLDLVYWEVVWRGGADIGVTYNSISRDGDTESCLLGHNEHSWSLECSEGSYTPCHNRKRFKSSSPKPFTHRVGVFLNWPAGSLSFYCVSQDAMVHLHTFTSSFTEPLYPGFWVWAYDGSVALCQVEMDWERLL